MECICIERERERERAGECAFAPCAYSAALQTDSQRTRGRGVYWQSRPSASRTASRLGSTCSTLAFAFIKERVLPKFSRRSALQHRVENTISQRSSVQSTTTRPTGQPSGKRGTWPKTVRPGTWGSGYKLWQLLTGAGRPYPRGHRACRPCRPCRPSASSFRPCPCSSSCP